MTKEQINEAASRFAARTEFGEVIFPNDYWDQFVAALAAPGAEPLSLYAEGFRDGAKGGIERIVQDIQAHLKKHYGSQS